MREKTLAALFLLAVGCGGEAVEEMANANAVNEPSFETQQSEIVGGTETTGTPAVVALYGAIEGQEGGMLCTATVVAPTVLLTAAHCVHPDTAKDVSEFVVFKGHNLTDPALRGDPVKVKSVHFHPSWSSSNLPGGHDLAVAILEEPIGIKPIPYNTKPLAEALRNAPARIIGYGLNNGFGQTGAGIKREALVKLNNWDDQFVKTGSWFGKTICNGDSGGPILASLNGVETLVGVNSFGFIFCLGEASSTRPDTNLDFIRQYLSAAQP